MCSQGVPCAAPCTTAACMVLQVANSLPIARYFPIFLSSRELKGLAQLDMYRTAESGASVLQTLS